MLAFLPLAAVAAPAPGPSSSLPLASFRDTGAVGARWRTTCDPVMGGVSTGNFTVSEAGAAPHGVWQGDVKIVPKLRAPGFCRVDAYLDAPKDLSKFSGVTFSLAPNAGGSLELEGRVLAQISGKGAFGVEHQWTAPLPAAWLKSTDAATPAYVPFAAFRPFGIRPEPGGAPTAAELVAITDVGLLADGTAGPYSVSIFAIEAATGPPAPGPHPNPGPTPAGAVTLFEFGKPGVAPWKVTNDPVMGGRSYSEFKVGSDAAGNSNIGLFTGDVEIVPSLQAPGFCNAYVELNPPLDISGTDALEIKIRSHGPLEAFKSSWAGKDVPKDPNCHHPGCQYQTGSFKASFNVTEVSSTAAVQTVTIPWTDYTYRWSDFTGGCHDHGAVCCSSDHPEVCPSRKALSSVSQVSIWGEGTAGKFALDIFSVRAIKL